MLQIVHCPHFPLPPLQKGGFLQSFKMCALKSFLSTLKTIMLNHPDDDADIPGDAGRVLSALSRCCWRWRCSASASSSSPSSRPSPPPTAPSIVHMQSNSTLLFFLLLRTITYHNHCQLAILNFSHISAWAMLSLVSSYVRVPQPCSTTFTDFMKRSSTLTPDSSCSHHSSTVCSSHSPRLLDFFFITSSWFNCCSCKVRGK